MDPIVAAGARPARRIDAERYDVPPPAQPPPRTAGDRIVRHGPPVSAASDVSTMPLAEKIRRTSQQAVAEAARHATGRLGTLLRDPKVDAGIAAGAVALGVAQAVPGADVAVDASLGLVGLLAYGAAGREHRDAMAAAVGNLGGYARDVDAARTQPQLDATSHELARALERGGMEAVDLATTLGGAGAGAFKVGAAAEHLAEAGVGALRPAGLEPATVGGFGGIYDATLEPSRAIAPGAGLTALQKRRTKPAQASLSAQPVERRPRANLETNEADGAHTIAKHVGKSDHWLRKRLKSESLEGASTFSSATSANRAIGGFVGTNGELIGRWAADPQSVPTLTGLYRSRTAIGRVIENGAYHPVDTKTALIVLAKDSSRDGWHVVTAYPVPDLRSRAIDDLQKAE